MWIARKHQRTFSTIMVVSVFTLSLVASTLWAPFASAVSNSQWQAGRIIDDAVFYDSGTMSISQIQSFLNSKVPSCDTQGQKTVSSGQTRAQYAAERGVSTPFICLKDYEQNTNNKSSDSFCNGFSTGTRSAARIIYEVAKSCGVNPKALIVLLQKEQSLITDDWPWPVQYQKATGYGCPDTAGCNANYAGFFNQVYHAARQFKVYRSYPHSYNHIAGANNNIRYNPNAACGSSSVHIYNQATAGLYNYTPYQPNSAILSGNPDGCSAYGNFNFWKLYWDWFGNPRNSQPYRWLLGSHNAYRDQARTQTFFRDTISLNPGEKAYLRVKAINAGNYTWNKSFTRLGTTHNRDRSSKFKDDSWITSNRAASLKESTVAPGDTGTFEFSITAPSTPGRYVESFGLVAEGKTWMNSLNLKFYVHVVEPATPADTNHTLQSGETLQVNDHMLSSDRHSVLSLINSGPQLRTSFGRTWYLNGVGSDVRRLVMQTDGNLVLRSSNGTALWSTNTAGNPGAYLTVQTDGNLVLRSTDSNALWSTGTVYPDGLQRVNHTIPQPTAYMLPGQMLETPNRKYRLMLQEDGNLVLRKDGKALWDSHTWGKNASWLVLQGDGNLVLRDKNGKAIWTTHTGGKGRSYLEMQTDGNLVLRSFGGAASWSTKTNGM